MTPAPATRRRFGAALLASSALAQPVPSRVIDAHTHLPFRLHPGPIDADRALIDAAARLGIHQLCCSILSPERPVTLDGFRKANRALASVTKHFPGKVLGYCFVNPGYGARALEEVRHYVENEGFIGVKIYNDYLATDPVVSPLLELAAKLRVPILHHAGHTSWLPSPQPNISDGGHIAEAARRFPETILICAHLCGGGDWEWTVKALRNAPTAFLDSSGSVADEGTIEMAVRVLGADRVLFGTDLSMTASAGRLRGAQIDALTRRKILGDNMAGILARRRA
ncbi:MAG: amidohydrolase family protein [Bryobacterales bacterium]|nr:amidohydrolase family protein [Bryobacterales bacterium]